MSIDEVKPIVVGSLRLTFDAEVNEDGSRTAIWHDDITGEAREQSVERVPTNPRWRDTVRRRMRRFDPDEQTPQALLNGVV